MYANKKRAHAIGVFDSGLGGLTVVRELMRQLPYEKIVYFGDTARVPYGTKSRESVMRFSRENAALLLKHNVKIIVVACNTSSSVALAALKRYCGVPVEGVIVPGARKAVSATKNKKIGVIATRATIDSKAYFRSIRNRGRSITVVSTACPLFVPLVEEGWTAGPTASAVAEVYLAGIKKSKADTVILGCTHYPLLRPVIQKVLGPRVTLIDSAREVAAAVKTALQKRGLEQRARRRPRHVFMVSDEPNRFRRMARRFLGYPIARVKKVM